MNVPGTDKVTLLHGAQLLGLGEWSNLVGPGSFAGLALDLEGCHFPRDGPSWTCPGRGILTSSHKVSKALECMGF
jgi:hypothetical protein